MPRDAGFIPAIAVPIGRAIAYPFRATADPTGLADATP